MREALKISRIFLFLFIIFAAGTFADAQNARAWVSGVGDDANPCTRTAPCKTFAGAVPKTAPNGEINCLDPGNYGAATIDRSITIDCTTVQGGVNSAGTNGLTINITNPGDMLKSVKLKNITLNGLATGLNGIRVLQADKVDIENVVIDNFTGHGISVEQSFALTKISVSDSFIRNNGGNGINMFIPFNTAALNVSNTQLLNNVSGINLSAGVSGGIKATANSSRISGNGTGVGSFNGDIMLIGCDISNNSAGVAAATGASIRLNGSAITSNNSGLSVNGGAIISFGNNAINGNTTNGSPTSTIVLQ